MNAHIQFEINWVDPPGGDREAGTALAWGEGLLRVDGHPVWFAGKADTPQPVAWSWIELLEFLAVRWLYLTTEQTYPRGLVVGDPFGLRAKARGAFASQYSDGDELPDDIDEEIFRFEGRHDLSRALRGISLPSLFVLREGNTVRISALNLTKVVASKEFFAQLEKIGDAISARLDDSKSDRARTAVASWKKRTRHDPKELIRLASGSANVGPGTLEFWELVDAPGADSELAAAARFMVGAAPTSSDFDRVLSIIRKQSVADCSKLDRHTPFALRAIDENENEDPYKQGYALALALRRELGLSDDHAVEVEKIVREFGVTIIEQTLSAGIDGIGVWGRQHGPAIIINTAGKRSSTPHGRRATIAHELCHLLADRPNALPLAEVMGGNSPYVPERRANAFGAEFLLPRWQARAIFLEKKSVESTITACVTRYRVGRVLAAAQLKNASNTGLKQSERVLLDRIVQEDRAYEFD